MRIIDTQEEEQRNRCSLYKLQCAHRLKYLIEQGKLSTKQYIEEQNRLDAAPSEMKECLSYLESILMRLEDVYFSQIAVEARQRVDRGGQGKDC